MFFAFKQSIISPVPIWAKFQGYAKRGFAKGGVSDKTSKIIHIVYDTEVLRRSIGGWRCPRYNSSRRLFSSVRSEVEENQRFGMENPGPAAVVVERKRESIYSWLIAFACFWLSFLTVGLHRSSGIIYVAVVQGFNVSREQASWPFSLCGSLMCLLGENLQFLKI